VFGHDVVHSYIGASGTNASMGDVSTPVSGPFASWSPSGPVLQKPKKQRCDDGHCELSWHGEPVGGRGE
jgi:hypothetical protein